MSGLAILLTLGVVLLMPLVLVYLHGAFRKILRYHIIGLSASAPHFSVTLASFTNSQRTAGNATRFCTDIDAIQAARLEAIGNARRLIQFETFIMTPGRRSREFAKALCQKAAAGVKVQLLIDGFGAKTLPLDYWRDLEKAGVEVRVFNPFSWRSPRDYVRRNHRKLMIIDQRTARIGGVGISDIWDGSNHSRPPWFDFEVQWEGQAVDLLTGFFWQHWSGAGGIVDLNEHEPDTSRTDPSYQMMITSSNDPSAANSGIRSLFQSCVLAAHERIWIASPYLLPDGETVELLSNIQKNGVDVRILTMGPRNDTATVYYVSRKHYGRLLKGGIKVHEYQPSMMHAKAILIDDKWVSLGSANLDPRSFFHNDELNMGTDAPHLIQNVERMFEKGFEQSRLVHINDWYQRSYKERIIANVANLLYWQL